MSWLAAVAQRFTLRYRRSCVVITQQTTVHSSVLFSILALLAVAVHTLMLQLYSSAAHPILPLYFKPLAVTTNLTMYWAQLLVLLGTLYDIILYNNILTMDSYVHTDICLGHAQKYHLWCKSHNNHWLWMVSTVTSVMLTWPKHNKGKRCSAPTAW